MDVDSARLAQPSRPGLPEARSDRDYGRARLVADDLEVVPLAHRRLVDVSGEDEICSRLHQRAQHAVAP